MLSSAVYIDTIGTFVVLIEAVSINTSRAEVNISRLAQNYRNFADGRSELVSKTNLAQIYDAIWCN